MTFTKVREFPMELMVFDLLWKRVPFFKTAQN